MILYPKKRNKISLREEIRMRSVKRKTKLFLKSIDGAVLGNTVLEKGMIIAPVVVMCISVINAVVISIAFALVTFFSVLISTMLPSKMPKSLRYIFHTLIASVVYIPVFFMLNFVFAETVYKIGIFIPLLVSNSLIVHKYEHKLVKLTTNKYLLYTLNHIVGFILAALVVGSLREIISFGTFAGRPLGIITVKGFAYPFGGFIVLGFMSAFIKKFNAFLGKRQSDKKIFNMEVLKDEPIE